MNEETIAYEIRSSQCASFCNTLLKYQLLDITGAMIVVGKVPIQPYGGAADDFTPQSLIPIPRQGI